MMFLSKQQKKWFFGATLCVILATTVALLTDLLLAQWQPTIDLSGLNSSPLSDRTAAILEETSGEIAISVILSTDHPAYYPIGRLLRAFAQQSQSVAGATISLTFIDPRKDATRAALLVNQGAKGPGLLFRQHHKFVFIPETALYTHDGRYDVAEAEHVTAAALARLNRPEGLSIGWISGHGEPTYTDNHKEFGFSALQRALQNEGYSLQTISLTDENGKMLPIPTEINLLLLIHPRYPLSTQERIQLTEWLESGGRLLYALPESGDMGLTPLLDQWGIQTGTRMRQPTHMTTASLGFTHRFSETHPITRDLAGNARFTLGATRSLVAMETPPLGTTSHPLIETRVAPMQGTFHAAEEDVVLAMAAERGSRAGEDLAFRSGRIILLGNSEMLSNRHLFNHASANRDFLINTTNWLLGIASPGHRGNDANVVQLHLTHRGWQRLYFVMILLLPSLLCALLWFFTRRRL